MGLSSNSEISGSLISYFSNKVKLYGGINLAQGIPGFRPPERLLDILSEIRFGEFHQYAPGTGNNILIDAIKKEYPELRSSTKIFVTSGATEAISLVYTYLERKYKNELNVLSFSPAYESYIHLPKIFGNNFFSYPMQDHNIFEEHEFENFFVKNKIKLLFIASPGNPYGKTLSKKQLQFLMDLAERNNAYIIIDAVYRNLYFTGEKPYYPTEIISPNIFYVNSFSKRFSVTGWRIGYLFMHESHFKEISYIHDYIGLSSVSLLQQAIALFLSTDDAENYVSELRNKIYNNYNFVFKELNSSGYLCPEIDGGYFVWARLPENIDDSLSFGLKLYENTKTAIIPGVHFGDEWKNYIRINVARETEELKKGVEALKKYRCLL